MTMNFKTCPFCGGESQELTVGGTCDPDEVPIAINCNECGALGPLVHVPADSTPGAMLFAAGEEWDKRAPVTEKASEP